MRRRLGVASAVAQPIVDHELQPGRDQHVEMRHRHEALALQQGAAHQSRIGLVEAGRLLAIGGVDRHVAAEARAGHAHPRATEIVIAAVDGALIARLEVAFRMEQRRIALGIQEVMLAHIDAMAEDGRHREQEGKLVPDTESIGQPGETPDQPLTKRSSHVPLLLIARLHQ
jgi:hypothetical protein